MGVEMAPQGYVNYRVMLMKIFSLTPLTPPQISKRWWEIGEVGKIEFYNFYLYLKEKAERGDNVLKLYSLKVLHINFFACLSFIKSLRDMDTIQV